MKINLLRKNYRKIKNSLLLMLGILLKLKFKEQINDIRTNGNKLLLKIKSDNM